MNGFMYLWSNEDGKEYAVVFEDEPTEEELSEYDRSGYDRQEATRLELYGKVHLWPIERELEKL